MGFRSSGGGLNGEGRSTPPANLTNVAARSVGIYHPHVVAGFSLRIRAPRPQRNLKVATTGTRTAANSGPDAGSFPGRFYRVMER